MKIKIFVNKIEEKLLTEMLYFNVTLIEKVNNNKYLIEFQLSEDDENNVSNILHILNLSNSTKDNEEENKNIERGEYYL